MHIFFSYHMDDFQLRSRLRKNPEYRQGRTLLEVKEDTDQMNVAKINVKAGIFQSKFVARIGKGEIEVLSQTTLLKAVYVVILIALSLVAAILTWAEIDMFLDATVNTDIYDLIVWLMVLVPIGLIWMVYIIFYKVKPKKILRSYFKETIPEEKSLDVYEIENQEAFIGDSEVIDSSKSYVTEEVPPIMRKFQKRMRVISLLGTLVIMVSLWGGMMLANKQGSGSDSYLSAVCFVFGVVCLLIWVLMLVIRIVTEKNEKQVADNARPYPATIVGIQMIQNSKNYIVVYEFVDEFKNYHMVVGIKQQTIKKNQNVEALIGKTTKIWYAPQYSIEVLEGLERPVIKPFYQEKSMVGRVLHIVIACAFLVAAVVLYEPIDTEGKSLEIVWNQKYKDTGLTQQDIESDTVQWICNTYAIRAESDGGQLYTIGIFEPTKENAKQVQKYLKETWGITNRKTAIDTINHVLEHGTRQKYREFVKDMKKDGWFELSEEEVEHKIQKDGLGEEEYRYEGAYLAYQAFGEKGVDAWDYCRMLRIAGECYVAGYINLEECMNQCLPIAQQLQEEFESWEEINDSYLYGYMYWGKVRDSGHFAAVYTWTKNAEKLMEMPNGPYELDYNLKLKSSWDSGK